MIVAFLTSVTLLPALLAVLTRPASARRWASPGWRRSTAFLERHRIAVVVADAGVVVLGAPLLYWLPFDFNPLHLQSRKAESVATFLELRRDPQTGANAIEIADAEPRRGRQAVPRLAALPEVARSADAQHLHPGRPGHEARRAWPARRAARPGADPGQPKPPPSDAENVAALQATAGTLAQFAGGIPGPAATRQAPLAAVARSWRRPTRRRAQRASAAFVDPLQRVAARVAGVAEPAPVTIDNLPAELKRAWLAPNGQARVQVLPKGDPDDTAVLRKFVAAVLAVEPAATGPAVMLYEAGNTILRAFIEAGAFALVGDLRAAAGDVAPPRRRADDAGAAAAGGGADAGDVRAARHAAQLRQHHRVAAAARGRRRLQDLLRHGVAARADRAGAVDPEPGGDLQRRRPPAPPSAACGCRAIPAPPAWAS